MTRLLLFAFLIASTASTAAGASRSAPPALFVRGDAVADGHVDLTDAIGILEFLFISGPPPACLAAADANDDGAVDLTDGIAVLDHLFLGQGPLPSPFPGCGAGRDGGLPCDADPSCEWESVAAAYGELTTLAGLGAKESDDAVNEWDPASEGGPATEAELSSPHIASADEAGNVYIADKDAHAVRKVTPEGKIITVAGTGVAGDGPDGSPAVERQLSSPNGLWVRADGVVYIYDLGNSKVRRLSPEGELTTLFQDPEGLVIGRGLWVRDDEQLAYIASGTSVKRWTRADGVVTIAAGFIQLANLAIDSRGRLFVTDRGANRAYRIDEAGGATPVAGTGDTSGGGDGAPALQTGLNEVRGIWFFSTGGYFLATHRGSQVWYVDTSGIIHLFLQGSRGAHAGDGEDFRTPGDKVSEVRAVTVDFQGNVLITEHDAGYVRKVARKPGT